MTQANLRRYGEEMDKSILTSTMRRAALEAGARIMQIYAQDNFDVQQKADDSPVTAADKAADQIICERLRAAFPSVPLITEEDTRSHIQNPRCFFLVDPLDGTKEFIKRSDDFTVNIAYVENKVPLCGVVYAPAHMRLFYTLPDGRAVEESGPDFALEHANPYRLLTPHSPDNRALRIAVSRSHLSAETSRYTARYAVGEMVRAGSSLKVCLIAAGEADLYPRLGRTMEWDTAAADAVLRGVGGRIVRFSDHMPLIYGKVGWENPAFIAAAKGTALLSA